MRILHTSDWHLGRIFHGESLIEDQQDMLLQVFTELQKDYDALLIAGDVFDRAVPPAEAVTLLNDFIEKVAALGVSMVMIPGNHDSMERLNYGAPLFEKHGIYLRCGYNQNKPVSISGRDGVECDIFALPFVDHTFVRDLFPGRQIQGKEQAVQELLKGMKAHQRAGVPSILVAHEFVSGAQESESERVFIGGSHVVQPELFEGFSFIALGHLHKAQEAGAPHVQYCGAPLAYSFGEAGNKNGMLSLEVQKDGAVRAATVQILPKRRLSVLEDTFDSLMTDSKYDLATGHYVSARITDPGYHHNIQPRLRERFPHLLEVRLLEVERRMAKQGSGPQVRSDDPSEVLESFLTLFNWEGDDRAAAKERVAQVGHMQEERT